MYSWWPSERTSTCKSQHKYFCISPMSLLVHENTPNENHLAFQCKVQSGLALFSTLCAPVI